MGGAYFRRTHSTAVDFVDEVGRALKILNDNGLRVHPASRFARYHATLRRVVDKRDVDVHVRSQAHLECSQLVTIVAHLVPTNDLVLRAKLGLLLEDSALPQESKTEAQGRNTQFELLVAAQCVRGGLRVHFEEPDLVVECGKSRVGVAAKRVKSGNQLRRNLSDARRQLLAHQHAYDQGIVAIESTHVANPQGNVVVTAETPQATHAAQDLLVAISDEVKLIVPEWAAPDHVLRYTCGVLIVAGAVHYGGFGDTVIAATATTSIRLDKNAAETLRIFREAVVGQE